MERPDGRALISGQWNSLEILRLSLFVWDGQYWPDWDSKGVTLIISSLTYIQQQREIRKYIYEDQTHRVISEVCSAIFVKLSITLKLSQQTWIFPRQSGLGLVINIWCDIWLVFISYTLLDVCPLIVCQASGKSSLARVMASFIMKYYFTKSMKNLFVFWRDRKHEKLIYS